MTREPWLMVRRELSSHRARWIMIGSFLLPIAIWCAFAYIPFFHGDYKLLITAERADPAMANFVAGDRVAKDYLPGYAEEVRGINASIAAQLEADPAAIGSSRTNLKRIRRIEPIADANGWLTAEDEESTKAMDKALYVAWGNLAEGRVTSEAMPLSDENLDIIRKNWEVMSKHAPGDSIKTPLLNLIPQGLSATPVFLPAPHECVAAAWDDFTAEPANNQPYMYERLLSSLRVVFGGFLMAAIIGLPIGVLCGSYDLFSKMVEPFTDFFRYMPAPTFSLLLVAAFGVEGAPKIALVFIGTVPHMILMIANTTRLLDRNLIEAAQTLGADRGTLMSRVIMPGIIPNVYTDLRVLLGWAWTWLVIAELIGTKTGLTAFIDTQGDRRNFDRVFPVIIMIGVIGFTTDQSLQALARVLFPWEYTQGKKSRLSALAFWRNRPSKPREEAAAAAPATPTTPTPAPAAAS
ncbi:MAG: ABC transporter permease [Planctomycetota bacterium]